MVRSAIQWARLAYAAVARFVGKVFFERSAGIDTANVVRLREVGLSAPGRSDYHPTPWLALKRVLPQQNPTDNDVFIDFGCGKGRVLFQAAMYPFRRVIGVELSAELADIARENMARALPKLKCRNIEVVTADIGNYEVPDDVTFVYFFDPVHGEPFYALVKNLVASLRRRPRELTIIYMSPYEKQALIDAGARLVATTAGRRPTKDWARETLIHVYKLGVPAEAQRTQPA